MTIQLSDFNPTPITVAESAKFEKDHELAHLHDIDMERIYLNIVGSTSLDTEVRDVILDAEFEESIDATPTFTVTIYDPDWALLTSGALNKAIDMRIAGIRWYRLNDIDINGSRITLTFVVRNAAYLMAHASPKKVTRRAGTGNKPKKGSATRAEFILILVRGVKKVTIPFYCKQLHQAQKIAKPVKQRKARDTRRDSGLPNDGIKSQGFPADEEQIKNIEAVLEVGSNKNASERALVGTVMCTTQEANNRRSATNGIHVGLFQQDPRYWPATRDPFKDAPAFYDKFIPLVKANPNGDLGELVDRIQGAGTPGAYNRWREEAGQTVDQYVAGGAGKSLEYRKRYEYEVKELKDGKFETWLACIYRLAEEVNWRAYWVRDTLHFLSEEDLLKGRSRATLTKDTPGIENVQIRYSRNARVERIILSARMERWWAPIGTVVTWKGAGVAVDGKYLVTNIRRPVFSELGEITLSKPLPEKKEPAPTLGSREIGGTNIGVDQSGGAKGIVEQAVEIAKQAYNQSIVVSDYRPGSTTSSGNVSDHSANDAQRAARDISEPGINALTGPPTKGLDRAAAAIGKAFGRDYGDGSKTIIDTFQYEGFQVQIIWRTPKFGGHMGHIHVGCHILVAQRPNKWPTAGPNN
jgi:hypothetical protein